MSAVTTGSASFARIHCADGYTTVIQPADLEGALLALEQDGMPLSPENGFPARLIMPGRYGYKQAKWVERIELLDHPVGGFWEDRGYDLHGHIESGTSVSSRSSNGGLTLMSGIAFAPQGICSVQISIDGGDWMPVTLEAQRLDDGEVALADWHIHWQSPHRGRFSAQFRVEAVNGTFSRPAAASFKVE